MGALGEDRYLPVGGRSLHYCVDGEGPVTVLFESGLGKSRLVWSLVQPEIAKRSRTVCYDRAGLGQSDRGQGLRTFEAILRDHLALLDALGHGPFVLVGHSYGGPIVRAAAARRPEKVVGVVVVDEVNENCEPLFSRQYRIGTAAAHRVLYGMSFLGLLRPLVHRTYMRELTGAAARESWDEEGTRSASRTTCQENSLMMKGIASLRGVSPDLLGKPFVSISSYRSEDGADIMTSAHRKTVEESGGRHVIAESRAHYLQLREPQVVVREIETIVGEVTQNAL